MEDKYLAALYTFIGASYAASFIICIASIIAAPTRKEVKKEARRLVLFPLWGWAISLIIISMVIRLAFRKDEKEL